MFTNNAGRSSMAKALNNLKPGVSVLENTQYKLAGEIGDFEGKLSGYVSDIRSKYRTGMNLTDEIIKIANSDNLTDDEIDRVCQATNMAMYQDLFEKTAGREDRSVNFSIAKPERVRESIRGVVEDPVKEAEEIGGEMEKAAGGTDLVSRLVNYDPSGRDTHYSAPAAPDAYGEYLFDKIAKDINADIEKAAALQASIDTDIQTLGVCFCKYASYAGDLDHQKVFDRMSFRSGLLRGNQTKVRDKFDEIKGSYKIASDVSLNLIDISQVEDFSLGNHSISKIAEADVATLPEVVDRKRDVRDFEKLVQIAMKIQGNDRMLEDINSNIEAKRQIVNANEEVLEEQKEQEEA